MQLAYGAALFGVNQTMVTSELRTRFNAGGQPYEQDRAFTVAGYLTGDGQAALTLAEDALKLALSVPYKDLVLYNDDGSRSSEILVNAGSISGVVVEDLEFPETRGPEYATLRSFRFRARACYPAVNSANLLLDFEETLTFWGGGPLYAHRNAINGRPQKQLIYPATVYHCTQQGSATGYRKYPTPPPPTFPLALKEAPAVRRKSPKRRGNGYEGYLVTWEAHFESATPLNAAPRLWVS